MKVGNRLLIKSLTRLPKRKVTVDEILGLVKLSDLLNTIYESREDISQCIFIWTTNSDGLTHIDSCGIDTEDEAIGVLERAKMMIFDPNTRCNSSEVEDG